MRQLWLLLVGLTGCLCQVPPPPQDAGAEPGVLKFGFELFGDVLRGDSVERIGTFTSTSSEAIELSALTVTGTSFFLVGPNSLRVPGHGEATVKVRFAPATLGPQAGVLTFETPALRGLQLQLVGRGIGPALERTPDRLDLGVLPLFSGVPATASAALTLRNAGIDGVPRRPTTALQLFFDVQSTSSALSEELCVGDCTATPFSLAVDMLTVIPITLSSTTAGLKTWDVRLFSNDPTAPMRTIPVTAEVVEKPTCRFAVPPALAFGSLTNPERRELEVLFENVGTEPCDVSGVTIGPQPVPLFSVVDAPVGVRTVAPGEVLRVVVRAWPQSAATATAVAVTADLKLAVNHPDGFARVPLTASLELSCLTVIPTPLDFATVQTGCRSADRTVTLRNTCTRALVINSASLPGFSSFSTSAALPRTLAPNDGVTVTVRYTPFTVGPERSAIDVTWLDGAAARHTTVPLLGEANTTGANTDLFPPRDDKLDLLLMLDDSASMTQKAARLASQLPRLLTALQTRNVDFRLGVINASGVANPGPTTGVLRRTRGLRWLTPTTPDLAARFAELTAFTGLDLIARSCEVPAVAALTAPVVSDAALNGGFLRADAALSVLCVTDGSDFSVLLDTVLQTREQGRLRWDVIGPTMAGSIAGCAVTLIPGRTGHADYTQATGGDLFDLCATDWSPLLNELAGQTTGPRPFFPLRARPDPLGTLPFSVTVAGQPVNSSVWAWDSVRNAVRFTAISAPAATDPVTISYPVSCAP